MSVNEFAQCRLEEIERALQLSAKPILGLKYLIEQIREHSIPSTVLKGGRSVKDSYRTSRTHYFHKDAVAQQVLRSILRMLDIEDAEMVKQEQNRTASQKLKSSFSCDSRLLFAVAGCAAPCGLACGCRGRGRDCGGDGSCATMSAGAVLPKEAIPIRKMVSLE